MNLHQEPPGSVLSIACRGLCLSCARHQNSLLPLIIMWKLPKQPELCSYDGLDVAAGLRGHRKLPCPRRPPCDSLFVQKRWLIYWFIKGAGLRGHRKLPCPRKPPCDTLMKNMADTPVYRGRRFIILIIIYTLYIKRSLWLKYSKVEEERCSTAAWSPPPPCMSPYVLERRRGSMIRCAGSCWPQRVLPKVGIACACLSGLGWAGAPDLPLGTFWS